MEQIGEEIVLNSYMIEIRIDGVLKEFEFSKMANEWVARKAAQKLITRIRERGKTAKFVSIQLKEQKKAL